MRLIWSFGSGACFVYSVVLLQQIPLSWFGASWDCTYSVLRSSDIVFSSQEWLLCICVSGERRARFQVSVHFGGLAHDIQRPIQRGFEFSGVTGLLPLLPRYDDIWCSSLAQSVWH